MARHQSNIDGRSRMAVWISRSFISATVSTTSGCFSRHPSNRLQRGAPIGGMRTAHFAHFASAVLIAGRDDAAAKSIVARFVSELGFDSLDVGGLAQGWKFEVDSRVFGAKLNLATVKAALL
jgi:hypothetical protein